MVHKGLIILYDLFSIEVSRKLPTCIYLWINFKQNFSVANQYQIPISFIASLFTNGVFGIATIIVSFTALIVTLARKCGVRYFVTPSVTNIANQQNIFAAILAFRTRFITLTRYAGKHSWNICRKGKTVKTIQFLQILFKPHDCYFFSTRNLVTYHS